MAQASGDPERWELAPPALVIRLELEAVPRAYVACASFEDEWRLLQWLEGNPRGVADLLGRVVTDPQSIFPWFSEAA